MANEENAKPIIAVVWDHFWLVLGCVGVVVGAGVAYTAVSKPVWEASATIVFPSRTPSLLGAGGIAEQGSLATALTGGSTPLKIYKGFLESERALKYVSESSGLRKKDIFQSRKIVDQAMESSLTVSVRNLDPEKAKQVVQAHLDALTKINEEVSEPLYQDDASVLGKKLAQQEDRVKRMEQQMLNFQQSTVTAPSVNPIGNGKDATVITATARWQDLQRQLEISVDKVNGNIRSVRDQVSKATGHPSAMPSNLPPVRKWRDKLVDLEYELRIKELTFAEESPEIQQLNEAVQETRKNLEREVKAYSSSIKSGAIDPTAQDGSLAGLITERFGLEAQLDAVKRLAKLAPGESIMLSRLTRELATQGAILQQLQSQYELAKIQEMRNPNKWQILDEPEVAEDPANKSFTKNGVISLLLGLMLGVMAALIRDSKRGSKEEDEVPAFINGKKAA